MCQEDLQNIFRFFAGSIVTDCTSCYNDSSGSGKDGEIVADNIIYAADITKPLADKAYGSIRNTLNEERREKADRFIFEKDRLLCASAGILLERALSQRGIISKRIACGEFGKPYLAECEGFHFNISHSEMLAVCAVSDRCVGADVEKIRSFDDDLCSYVCSEREIERVKSLCAGGSPDRLYTTLWTVKESLMKYYGTGLSLHPRKIEVTLGDTISARCSSLDTSKLSFTVLEHDGYIITVCSEYSDFCDKLSFIEIQKP